MSAIADRYRRLAGEFADTVAKVPDDGWQGQSPCEDWTACDVVQHMLDTHRMFLGFVGRELPDGPAVADDPSGAWNNARSTVQADLDDPERASTEFEGQLGTSTFEKAVDRFLCTDLVLHRWDLAKATGQEIALDPRDMSDVRASMANLADKMRGPGAFGEELTPPPGADEQAAFLAYFGREA